MKQRYILCLLMVGDMMMASCGHRSDKSAATVEDDRPPLEYTDADRVFSVVLEISNDSLLTCRNNFSGSDDNPLILDTSNPGFFDYLSQWFDSMDSVEVNRLKATSELHISVGPGVSDATLEKVKRNVRNCGIDKVVISNF